MNKYILVHDVGTTGNKACLFNTEGKLKRKSYYPYKTYYPKYSYAEQSPDEWLKAICLSTKELLSSEYISPGDVECVSFSGQNPCCIPLDKDGNLIYKSIPIYADLRAREQADRVLEAMGGKKRFYDMTGTGQLPEQCSAFKMMWFRENKHGDYKRVYKFLNTVDYIIYKLTGKIFTDYSQASNTGLFDISSRKWSKEMLKQVGISEGMLPEIRSSTDLIGGINSKTAKEMGLIPGTPVVMGGADVSCAATGAGVVRKGINYICLGSSAWVGMYSDKPELDSSTSLANFCHLMPKKYALHHFLAGSGLAYQWVRDNIFDIKQEGKEIRKDLYKMMDEGLEKVKPGSGNIIFLPYMKGLWAGKANPNARGVFIGLRIEQTKYYLARAVLEGIGFGLRILLDMFENQGINRDEIRIIGGGAKSKIQRQIIADICNIKVICPSTVQEGSSFGAAVCAGVGMKIFENFSVTEKLQEIVDISYPREEIHKMYSELYQIFKESYSSLVPIFDKLSMVKNE